MPTVRLESCPEFTAGNGCRLREILHPDRADLALRYSLAHATVAPGQTTALHQLTTSEVYYILEGQGRMSVDGVRSDVGSGDTVYIPPNARQSITNTGTDSRTFLCIVDPAWRVEDETILAQDRQQGEGAA